MLENLDRIDWKNLDHTSRYSSLIPQKIRELVSDDKIKREKARMFLFDYGQDAGTVSEATQYIVPFIIELLDNDGVPDKHWLLDELAGLDLDLFDRDLASAYRVHVKPPTYDAVEAGIPVYLKLLKDSDVKIRSACIDVFERLTKSREKFLSELISAYGSESDENVRALLYAVINFES